MQTFGCLHKQAILNHYLLPELLFSILFRTSEAKVLQELDLQFLLVMRKRENRYLVQRPLVETRKVQEQFLDLLMMLQKLVKGEVQEEGVGAEAEAEAEAQVT